MTPWQKTAFDAPARVAEDCINPMFFSHREYRRWVFTVGVTLNIGLE